VAAGHGPGAVAQVAANLAQKGNPWGADEPDLIAVSGAKPARDVLVYFGAAARVHRPETMRALSKLLTRAGVTFSVLADERDPGLLLHQLGDTQAGAAAASALFGKIARSGVRIVVTPDTDAYRTFKGGFGEVEPLAGPEIWHASEFLAK